MSGSRIFNIEYWVDRNTEDTIENFRRRKYEKNKFCLIFFR
jgi:hypothetical protein